MSMSAFFDIALMTNNYSHDIATAMLAVSGASLWIISRAYPASKTPAVDIYFVCINKSITRLAVFSLLWIVVAGVPRTIFYKQYEWYIEVGSLQIIAIIIKHVFMFTLVGMGLFYWAKVNKTVRRLKLKHNIER
jgi:hypothetical protein